jgi:ribonuclease HII
VKQQFPSHDYERELRCQGYNCIVGIDEVGRGALAGPVVAAAVVLGPECTIDGVRDSKLVPEAEREQLYEMITNRAVCWSVGIIDSEIIDEINILQATFVAMRHAVASLSIVPHYALIDGRDTPSIGVPCQAIIGGDGLSMSIAAASIVAKVTRDRIMREYHETMPNYGFARHKGYATVAHRSAILQFGPVHIHRRSFLGKLMQEQELLAL